MKPGERSRAIYLSTLNFKEKAVLLAIADHMSVNELSCWPSQGRLSTWTSMSVSTVGRTMRKLQDKGLLTTSKHGATPLLRISWSLLGSVPQTDKAGYSVPQTEHHERTRSERPTGSVPQTEGYVPQTDPLGQPDRQSRVVKQGTKQGTEAARARTREAPPARNGPVTDQVKVPAPDHQRNQADDLPSHIYETLIPAAVEAEQPPPATPPSTPERGAHHHTDTNMAADASAPPAHPSRRQRKMLEAQQQRHQEQVKATGMRLFQPPPLDPAQALAKLEQLTAQRYDHEQIAAIMGDHDLAAAVYHSQQLEAEAKIIPLRQPETGP